MGWEEVGCGRGYIVAFFQEVLCISLTQTHTQSLPPPERFMTRGAVGPHFLFPQLLDDLDLLKQHEVRVLFVKQAVIQY